MFKLVDAISKKYSFIKGDTQYQLIREHNKPLVGYVYVDDKHIATINYDNVKGYVSSIYVATHWESATIKNILNKILKQFTGYTIYQKNYIWYFNKNILVISGDLLNTIEHFKNSSSMKLIDYLFNVDVA